MAGALVGALASGLPAQQAPGAVVDRPASSASATPASASGRTLPRPLARKTTPPRLAPASRGTPALAAGSLRDSIVALARAQLGRRYVLGGADPERGFDCSGLIRYLAQALDLDVPRTANDQARAGAAVAADPARLRPGDLLTFGHGSRVSHIGIYVGDGKFVHASTAAGRVVESRLDRRPARGIKPWKGVRRLFADVESAATTSGGDGDGEG